MQIVLMQSLQLMKQLSHEKKEKKNTFIMDEKIFYISVKPNIHRSFQTKKGENLFNTKKRNIRC